MTRLEDRNQKNENPCIECGACCATYRVSFYWSEANALGLPEALTEQVNHFMRCMKGTDKPSPRCEMLEGSIGIAVSCAVYNKRPSPCRELMPGEDKCNRARERHGLEALIGLQTNLK